MPKKCSRTRILLKKLTNDWNELNVAFKSLIIICCILFIVVICMAIFVDVDKETFNINVNLIEEKITDKRNSLLIGSKFFCLSKQLVNIRCLRKNGHKKSAHIHFTYNRTWNAEEPVEKEMCTLEL